MDPKWFKYTYVCHTCDALIEYTIDSSNIPADVDMTQFTCICGGIAGQLSVEDATILPITEKKEDPMTTATTTYMEEQVNELKAQLANHQNCDYWKAENGRIGSQLIELVNDAYEDGYKDKEEILTEICSIIDYEPKKTVEFTATMRFTGQIEVDLADANDFDLTDILSEAYVDINHGDVVIDSYELYDAEEC